MSKNYNNNNNQRNFGHLTKARMRIAEYDEWGWVIFLAWQTFSQAFLNTCINNHLIHTTLISRCWRKHRKKFAFFLTFLFRFFFYLLVILHFIVVFSTYTSSKLFAIKEYFWIVIKRQFLLLFIVIIMILYKIQYYFTSLRVQFYWIKYFY